MANLLSRVMQGIRRIPRRILSAMGWTHVETPGGSVDLMWGGDADALEAKRRCERETWRGGVEEDNPPGEGPHRHRASAHVQSSRRSRVNRLFRPI